ncbi:hypothetical protein EMB92_04785 [Bifidobacterium callitrichos]|uniref:Uncharacterized protein n=1 Tax=Bifidobacterium callitrichos TaxID=762209 RepID=A0A5M9ZCA7_9BIFI|nr:hypothetical protein [Bifidobacterium callitrichos]KAA8816245.1 hypothetical protein EMB92_04785 [Bifidobacterium callitrichos]
MQTLRDSDTHAGSALGVCAMHVRRTHRILRARHARAWTAAAVSLAMIASLSGCASGLPHLQAQVDDATTLSACESAYLAATSGKEEADARPVMMRYLAARTAADAWTDVAVNCTGRFAEGTLHAAQASYTAQQLASRLGLPELSPATVDYGDVVKLDIADKALDAIALAEDRAGFSIEVLAARKVNGATLAMSDNHKTAAQHLFSLSGTDKDPRRKVYTVNDLISHPDSISDPATGITANTVSVVEMNCAREYLDAISGAIGESTSSGESTTGNESDAAIRASAKTLKWLSRVTTARAWRAFDLGYPTFDAALFS